MGLKSIPQERSRAQSYPALEVFDREGVAVDFLSFEIGIDGVEIQAELARDEGGGLVEVGLKLGDIPGAARVIAGCLDAAAGGGLGVGFKPRDVVALPAVEGDGDGGERLEGGLGVDAPLGELVAGGGVVGHSSLGYLKPGGGGAQCIKMRIF